MKKVILCEGYVDSLLMKMLFEKFRINKTKIKFFVQRHCDNSEEKKHEESVILRSFFQSTSSHKTLVKAEGGKDVALEVFSHFMIFLFTQMEKRNLKKINLLVDLDADKGKCLDDLFASIDKIVFGSRLGSKMELETRTILKNDYLTTLEFSVVIKNVDMDSEKLGSFYITAFEKSLETEAGINKGDVETIKKSKIGKLLKNEYIFNHFNDVFNN